MTITLCTQSVVKRYWVLGSFSSTGVNYGGVRQPISWHKFCQKLHESEKNGLGREAFFRIPSVSQRELNSFVF